jgi:hypothetical protein
MVGRFEGQRDKSQPEFRNVQDFFYGQRFHNRTLVRADNDRAFFFQAKERFADWRAADFEFFRQLDLSRVVSRLEGLIENSLADPFNYEDGCFFGLRSFVCILRGRGLVHRHRIFLKQVMAQR